MDNCHPTVKISLKCGFCDKEFCEKLLLNDHIYSHIKGKALIKQICTKGFSDISELNEYFMCKRQQSSLPNIFCCEVCNEEISDMSHFNQHIFNQSKRHQFQCLFSTSNYRLY